MRYVLDANIVVAALNGVPAVRARLENVPGSEVGIPIVAVAELTFGAYKSKRREANLARIGALRRSITVLPLTDGVVDLYGSTRAGLESRGIVEIRRQVGAMLLVAAGRLEQAREATVRRVARGLGRAGHAEREPIDATLVPSVDLEEGLFVAPGGCSEELRVRPR